MRGARRLRLLGEAFYARHTVEVARDLVGKVLAVRRGGGLWVRARILETEAYRADDPASHSARGMTERNRVMFGPPGRAYVYFIYGMYDLLNFVAEPEGEPGAALIRALEPLDPEPEAGEDPRRASGPGKLCRWLGITRARDNGEVLWGERFRVYDDGFACPPLAASPRVGITKGADIQWRFYVPHHRAVSRAPQNRLGVIGI